MLTQALQRSPHSSEKKGILTQQYQGLIVLLHVVSLTWVLKFPLPLGEIQSHLLEGHQPLKQQVSPALEQSHLLRHRNSKLAALFALIRDQAVFLVLAELFVQRWTTDSVMLSRCRMSETPSVSLVNAHTS